MRRLSYAPKSYVFIRSSNLRGKIFDVSDDVVSGSVNRVINNPSTAEVVLRNRFKKYIRDDSGASIFLPMDMISIWLQRIAGKPIRVFTGYLDSVPYYQGYPGNCTITATCTLKRLSYQWFDPGLEFFREWLFANGQWIINPDNGLVTNVAALTNPSKGTIDKSSVNDGSFGQLTFDFMTQIAGWDKDSVLVSDIDPSIARKAAELYRSVQMEAEHDLDTLAQYLGKVMGLTTNDSSTTDMGIFSTQQETITKTLKKQTDNFNIPLVVAVTAALLQTKYDPTYHVPNTKNPDWGFGLFGLRPPILRVAGGKTITGTKIDGYSLKEIQGAGVSARVFCKRLLQANLDSGTPATTGEDVRNARNDYLSRAQSGDPKAIKAWIEKTLATRYGDGDFAAAINRADQYVGIWNSQHPKNASTVLATPLTVQKHLTWKSSEVKGFLNNGDSKTFQAQYAGHIYDSLAPYYWRSQKMYNGIALSSRSGLTTNHSALVLRSRTSNQSQLQDYFQSLRRSPEIEQITYNGGKREAWRNGVQISADSVPSSEYGPANAVVVKQVANAPDPTWTGSAGSGGGGSSSSPDPTAHNINHGQSLTMEQLGTLSFDAAFAAQFTFPTDFYLAQSLTGERALMNDIPCIEAVKQFCSASMRAFMSLPDGRFIAFYPDYFGSRRKPYWAIYDIETKNLGIQLSDEQLATHVYVVGSTFAAEGGITPWDRVSTAGVATIAQAFILDSFIVPQDKGQRQAAWGRLRDAYDFLQHYGARPLAIEAPYIKNTLYEFLMAWQVFMQKWAGQFATTVDFTFQPEVMAGGILAFPHHDLQMFVESVTHSWDYSSGFSTQAVLSSPAVISKKGSAQYPGMALAGNVNTIGVGAGGS